jgi:DNA sulfur modification protein DndD
MLLQTIELQNFRQFVNEKIDFSTDPERNVTLIIGENGTGKTTFAQAFFWCFYGETDFSDKIILNRSVIEKMTPDQKETVRVAIRLTHGSAEYEIIRTQEYKKAYTNRVTAANTVLNVQVKSADGNTRYLKPLECESAIQNILPKELANYFFFDGERIEKMSKEIASGRKSSGFSNAVVGLTGLKATLAALDHLSPTRTSSVMGKLTLEYRGDSDGKMQQLTKRIGELQDELERITVRLSEIDDEIESATTSRAQFEQDIKQFADGEKLQNERERLRRELADVKRTKATFVKDICKAFNDGMPTFFGISMVKDALEVLSHSDFSGKDIPEMHAKTIQFLLKRGTCICGMHLDPGTIPYNKVMELMDYLPPQSIGVTVGQFIKDSRMKYSRENDLLQQLKDKMALISTQTDKVEELKEDIAQISDKLDGADVREQVRKINGQITACTKIISARKDEQKRLLIRQGQCEEEKKQKENRRSELSLLDKNNQKIELYKAYTQQIYDELLAEYKEKEKNVRERLERSINEIFKSIYDGGLSLSIDEKYNISVYVTDFEGGVETSTAQSISVIFAFISAIIKMARDNQVENGDEAYSEPYPLVMDAPLSAFDKRRIKAICSAIPETAEQVIIFIKDTDGELAEDYLGTRVMKRHYFEKVDEFNTHLR